MVHTHRVFLPYGLIPQKCLFRSVKQPVLTCETGCFKWSNGLFYKVRKECVSVI